ncbi:sensor histidine kinase [Megalodesulfovibrio paquesii]
MTNFFFFLAGFFLAGAVILRQQGKIRFLQSQEDACRSLLQNSSDVFYRTDLQGRLLMISQSALELTGYGSMKEVLHHPVHSFWKYPHERTAMLEAIRRHGSVQDYEVVLERKDGTLVTVAVTSRFYTGRHGMVQGVEGMFRDITSRKTAEAELQEAERKYRELFELAPVAIFRASLKGRFLTVNPEYSRMIGYSSPEEMISSITDIASQLYENPADRDRYLELLRTQGRADAFETRLRRLNGEVFWAAITTRIRRASDGDTDFIYGFIVDITRQKEEAQFRLRMHEELEHQVAQRTRELEHSNRRLRELDQLKTNFLSSASHELRTPLTSILGFAKITGKAFQRYVESCPTADPLLRAKADTITANLTIIAKEGLRLARLVNDLLDVNRIESGVVEWRLEAVAVSDLMHEAAQAVSGDLAMRPDLAVVISPASPLPPILVDKDRMQQVLLNLLHNAIKFTPHGEIRLLASMAEDDPNMVEMVVEDDGPGIPAKDLELVFDKFFQSRMTNVSGLPAFAHPDMAGAKGAGLGLTICKQIVEHLGGHIHAESPAGTGARIVMRLPTGASLPAPPLEHPQTA